MKKYLMMLCLAVGASAFALPEFLSFKTEGIDRYGDGKQVLDGECYALVRIFKGKTFAGIAANGREADATTGKIWCTLPIAKNGRCPRVIFQLEEGVDFGNDGTWAIYMLDTRVFANGKFSDTLAGLDKDGFAKQVNSYGAVEGATIVANTPTKGAAVTADSKSSLLDEWPSTEITSVKIEGPNVRLKVKNTLPYLQYNVSAGEGLGGMEIPSAETAQAGADNLDDEIELIVPKPDGDAGFFKVIRN